MPIEIPEGKVRTTFQTWEKKWAESGKKGLFAEGKLGKSLALINGPAIINVDFAPGVGFRTSLSWKDKVVLTRRTRLCAPERFGWNESLDYVIRKVRNRIEEMHIKAKILAREAT
jgi:hypothetical protein